MIAFTGRVAVYFNRHSLDGLVWCLALRRPSRGGDVIETVFELAVRGIEIRGAELVTHYEPQITLAGERRHDGPPSAWQEGWASVELTEDGRAILKPARSVVTG